MDSARQALTLAALLALYGCAIPGPGPAKVGVPLATGVMPVAVPATLPLAESQKDSAAKTFNIPADKAALYVYRNEFRGSGTALPIFVDGKLRGGTAYRTYVYVEVPAGQHTVTSKSYENESSVVIDAVAGRAHFVWQEIKIGWQSPRTTLHVVDEPTGRAGVLESKMTAF